MQTQKYSNGSLPEIKFPEQMVQACPYCGTKHPIIVRGVVKNPETQQGRIIEDRGYSFCNCKNIWYTDWENIDLRVYDNEYRERYKISQTKRLFDYAAKVHFPIFKEHKVEIKTFAEIGSIHDAILDNAALEGWNCIGIDIIEGNESKYKRYIGNIEDKNTLKDLEPVDIIWASHIIEHLKKPLQTMNNLYEKLAPGGMIYIAMPDPFFIDWAKPYDWGHWVIREHHILWDMASFIKECEAIGFKTIYKNRNLLANFISVRDFQLVLQK